ARRGVRRALFALALSVLASDLRAQRVEARLGALISTTLVEDLGANAALQLNLPADYASPVKIKLAPAPVASVGLVQDLSPRVSLELMGSVAVSKLRAHSRAARWDMQDVSLAALSAAVRYAYRPRVNLHGGIGVTRFITESASIFSEGIDSEPLLELGVSTSIPAGALPIRGAVRMQAHTFGTPALQRAGASNGRVLRLLIQAGIGG
ncbi:MAG: hypothetical protein ACREMA_06310, partial [Longimicrobiales bacterium]